MSDGYHYNNFSSGGRQDSDEESSSPDQRFFGQNNINNNNLNTTRRKSVVNSTIHGGPRGNDELYGFSTQHRGVEHDTEPLKGHDTRRRKNRQGLFHDNEYEQLSLDEQYYYEDPTDYGDEHVYESESDYSDSSDDDDDDSDADDDDHIKMKDFGYVHQSGGQLSRPKPPDTRFFRKLIERAKPIHWVVLILSIATLFGMLWFIFFLFGKTLIGRTIRRYYNTFWRIIRVNTRVLVRKLTPERWRS